MTLGGLAACGEGSPGPPTAQGKDVEPYINQQPTFSTDLDNQVYPAGYERFAQEIGVRISATTIPEADIRPKVTALLAAGTPPDGSYMHPSNSTSVAAAGLILPIDAFVSKDRSLNLPDLYPSVLAYFRAPSVSGHRRVRRGAGGEADLGLLVEHVHRRRDRHVDRGVPRLLLPGRQVGTDRRQPFHVVERPVLQGNRRRRRPRLASGGGLPGPAAGQPRRQPAAGEEHGAPAEPAPCHDTPRRLRQPACHLCCPRPRH
jgi:hypothetical protein